MRSLTMAIALTACMACGPDAPNTVASTTSPRSAVVLNSGEPTHIFKGIALSSTEKEKMFAINTRYNEQIYWLRKKSANPNGPIDPSTLAQLRVIRSAQLAEWREAMTANNALRFDRNRQLIDAQEAQLRAAFPASAGR
jgi:hypothetical protein